MRKMLVIIISIIGFCYCTVPAMAQGGNATWETMWIYKAHPTPPFAWMGNPRGYTDIAYDPARDQVYVPSPQSKAGKVDPHIYIFDATTGALKGEFNMNTSVVNGGFSQGVYCVYKITVDDSGWIYVGNLTTTGSFRLYRWKSPTANPELVFTGLPNNRWGDDIAAIGHKQNTRVYVVGGDMLPTTINNDVAGLAFNASYKAYQYCLLTSTVNHFSSHGIDPTGLTDNDPLWGDSNVRVATMMQNGKGTVPTVSLWELKKNVTHSSGPIRYFKVIGTNKEYVVVADGQNARYGDSTKARLIDITRRKQETLVGDPTPPIHDYQLVSIGGRYNYVAGVDFKFNQKTGELWLFVLHSNNGFAAFKKKVNLEVPVELAHFSAMNVNGSVRLTWRTESEQNNLGFYVQRNAGGENWETIGFVSGNGTTTRPNEYRFVDDLQTLALRSGVLRYRLEQWDLDGTKSHSPVVEIPVRAGQHGELVLLNYPNPLSVSTTIYYQLPEPSHVVLRVYDFLGREIMTLVDTQVGGGSHAVPFNASGLPDGMYTYTLRAGELFAQGRMLIAR